MAKKPFKMEGLENLQKKIKDLPADLLTECKQAVRDAADEIVIEAAAKCPVDTGRLKGSIISLPINNGLSYQISANVHYAPYVEFGTGTMVDVPKGLEDYAIQFKGKGIRKVNLPARPFFFPAFRKRGDELIKELHEIVKRKLEE